MTLAFSRKSRCRRGILAGSALSAVLLGCLFGLSSQGEQRAEAASTGNLVPVAATSDASWTPNAGPTAFGAVDDGVCGAGDGQWITGTYPETSTYAIDTSTIPVNSLITSIDVTVCYSDADGADLLQGVRPLWVQIAQGVMGQPSFGNVLNPGGSTSIVQATHGFGTSFELTAGLALGIGVQDAGYIGRVNVHAIWAVVHYTPPQPPQPSVVSMGIVDGGFGGPIAPYRPGWEFSWTTVITVSGPPPPPATLVISWDSASVVSVFGAPSYDTLAFRGCLTGSTFTCAFVPVPGVARSYELTLRMRVLPTSDCEAWMQATLSSDPVGAIIATASDQVAIVGNCPTPTPTLTPMPTPTVTTPPSAFPSAPGSPTATQTPTPTVTSTSMSAATPGGNTPTATSTPTGTASPTATPVSRAALKYKLRTMQLAYDGFD